MSYDDNQKSCGASEAGTPAGQAGYREHNGPLYTRAQEAKQAYQHAQDCAVAPKPSFVDELYRRRAQLNSLQLDTQNRLNTLNVLIDVLVG